jgi:hypothetical protein
LNVLHIWDQAGVACILAREHRKMGYDVTILKRAGYDPFEIFKFYGELMLDMRGGAYLKYVLKEAKKYDLVHVHSLYRVVPDLKRKYPDKKIILEYHGSELRGKRDGDPTRKEAENKADAILVSTPDLLEFVRNAKYIPNPVDTEHFKPDSTIANNRAFMFKRSIIDTDWVFDYLKKNNIDTDVEVVDRDSTPIAYKCVPSFLKQYGIYVDIRYISGILLSGLSKTALESLSCGLRVLNNELKYLQGLPEEHRPQVAANKMLDVYRSIS